MCSCLDAFGKRDINTLKTRFALITYFYYRTEKVGLKHFTAHETQDLKDIGKNNICGLQTLCQMILKKTYVSVLASSCLPVLLFDENINNKSMTITTTMKLIIKKVILVVEEMMTTTMTI